MLCHKRIIWVSLVWASTETNTESLHKPQYSSYSMLAPCSVEVCCKSARFRSLLEFVMTKQTSRSRSKLKSVGSLNHPYPAFLHLWYDKVVMMRTGGYFPGLVCEEKFCVLIYSPCLNLKKISLLLGDFLPLDAGLNELMAQGNPSEFLYSFSSPKESKTTVIVVLQF